MRRALYIGVAMALLLGGCGAAAAPSQTATGDVQAKADTYDIEQIESTWHKSTSTKDVDLMMTLWADNASFTTGQQTFTGKDQIRNFFVSKAGPFQAKNTWVSETPAYKIEVTVDGDKGTLSFECHYVDADPNSKTYKQVMSVVGADQAVQKINGKWLITNSVASSPTLEP